MNIIKVNLKTNGTPIRNNVPQYIMLHHAEASICTIYDINNWHLANGWIMIGYQYFVRKDGSIFQGRDDNMQGSHCPNYNTRSIGICAEGDFMKETMPDVQKKAIIELCIYLTHKYNIRGILGHRECYNTQCPADSVVGGHYPLAEIKNSVMNNKSNVSVTTTNSNTSNNSSIVDYQTKLNRLQFSCGTPDGIAGTNTLNAVKNFQKTMGLVADGVVGSNTLNAINHILSKPTLSIGCVDNFATRYIQYRINISVDGIFGAGTQISVKKFQSNNKLSADGIVGNGTWSVLIK